MLEFGFIFTQIYLCEIAFFTLVPRSILRKNMISDNEMWEEDVILILEMRKGTDPTFS